MQVGSDADLTIFDLRRASSTGPPTMRPIRPSAGIEHVLVGGTFVVRDGALVDGVQARPVRSTAGTWRRG